MYKQLAFVALLAASCGARAASDADLAAIRAQIDDLKKNYEQRIATLERKLADAEALAAARAAVAVPPVATATATVPLAVGAPRSEPETAPARTGAVSSAASAFNPEISLILQGQYARMQDVPDRSITGFWPAGEHGGHGGVSSRGFSLTGTELVIGAGIDPYWRGQAIFAVQDDTVEVEEAWFQSLAIGHGVGLKGGRFKSDIGYQNRQHPHQWDFANSSLMYVALFGPEASFRDDGLQLKWLAPTPIFLEFGGEAGRGANYPGSDSNKNGVGAWALYAHLGDDVGDSSSWRAGLSYLKTKSGDREADFFDVNGLAAQVAGSGDSATWIGDFVWKWAPDGNPARQNFKFQAEYFQRREKGALTCSSGGDGAGSDGNGNPVVVPNACAPDAGGNAPNANYAVRQSGWYAQGVYQFTPNWRAGLRYDQLDSGRRDLGIANLVVDGYRPKRATAMIDYSWSEFSRVRLQYAHDQSMAGISDNQWIVQYIMSLGSHGAHRY